MCAQNNMFNLEKDYLDYDGCNFSILDQNVSSPYTDRHTGIL